MCAGTLQRESCDWYSTVIRYTFTVMCCLLQIYIRKLYFVFTDLVFFLATVFKTYGVRSTYAQNSVIYCMESHDTCSRTVDGYEL